MAGRIFGVKKREKMTIIKIKNLMAGKSNCIFNGHCLMLVQFSQAADSRTYLDFDRIDDGLESLCRIYEGVQINKKKNDTGNKDGKVDYDLTDLLKFLDSVHDLSALVFNEKANGYMAHGREWIKAKIYKYLKECAVDK